MVNPASARNMVLAVIGSVLGLGCWAATVSATPLERAALRVAVAPVADGRTLAFPDGLPLHVEIPTGTLIAQPRGLPRQLHRRLVKVLAKVEGVEAVEAPELPAQPGAKVVRSVAERRRLDAVLASEVTVGFGQMRVTGFRRRAYMGRVQLALTVLSGRTGKPLGPSLVLEGTDDIDVDFRQPMDFDTLHHRGAGPEVRERVEAATRSIGKQLRAKFSRSWLAAALAKEGRSPVSTAAARLTVERVVLEPETIQSGQKARMVITYSVSGLAPGAVTPVRETRNLLRDGGVVAGPFRVTHSLGNGTHTSVQDLRVPTDAEAGQYTLQGAVEAAGVQATGSGTFVVLSQ